MLRFPFFVGLAAVIFACGPKVGRFVSEYPSGRIESEFMGYPDASGRIVMHGRFAEYYEDGKLKTDGTYTHGRLSDRWVWYDRNGRELAKSDFENGTGKMFSFYPSGRLESEAEYENGLLHGRHIEYNPDGSIAEETEYRAGRKLPAEEGGTP